MKIWTLMENTAEVETVRSEHGLSLYIETGSLRILFDAGQSAAFAENAEMLGIDLGKVDYAVLSHGHYDHGGGMEMFLEKNSHAPIYISPYALGDYYNSADRYIGLSDKLKQSDRLVPVEEAFSPAEGITLLSCNTRKGAFPAGSFGLQKMGNGILQPDDFCHEQYLLIEEKGKRILFTGCSHRGILNIAEWIPCDVCIGGFHFVKLDPQSQQLRHTAKQLLCRETVYYTCHCTGVAQYQEMKKIMGQKLSYLAAGSYLEL